jgi:ketosteroid isomerase-like protein
VKRTGWAGRKSDYYTHVLFLFVWRKLAIRRLKKILYLGEKLIMKKYYLLILCFFLMPGSSFAQNLSAKDEAAIKAVFKAQEDCWNHADIDCFMEGYIKSGDLLFIGSSGIQRGWQSTIERYKRSYPNPEAMGQLTFTLMEFRKLGPKSAWVLGKFYLKRDMGDLSGHFTLVWKKIKGEWLILSDHTSG